MPSSSRKPKNHQVQEFTVSTSTIVRVLVSVFVFLAVLAFLSKASYALLLLAVSFFLALALNAPVQWLSKRLHHHKDKERRTAATVISFLFIIIVLGGFVASVTPPIVRQTHNLVNNIPSYVAQVQDSNSDIGQLINKYNLNEEVKSFSDSLSSKTSNITNSAVSVVSSVVESVVSIITILVLTFMMLIEGPRWLKLGTRLLPDKHKKHVQKLAGQMYGVVRGYTNGQVILALIAALLILPALLILGVGYPIALTFVVFLLGLVPLIGHTISAIVLTAVALFHSLLAAIILFVYYVIYINIENYVIQPQLQSMTTKLSPLSVIVAIVIGVSFGGIAGGLLSIPIAGCLRVLAIDYVESHNLGKPDTKLKAT